MDLTAASRRKFFQSLIGAGLTAAAHSNLRASEDEEDRLLDEIARSGCGNYLEWNGPIEGDKPPEISHGEAKQLSVCDPLGARERR